MVPVPVRRVLYLLLLPLCAYLALVALVWSQQDLLVFPGAGRGVRPLQGPDLREFALATADGTSFRAVERVPERPLALVLAFVGNGEDLASAAWHVHEFAGHGAAAVGVEYPGYGGSGGRPSVAALFACAEAAADYAGKRAAALGVPLLVSGASLGSFCAVHVAAMGRCARLLLRAPPTALADAAGVRFWWLPVRLLLRHRFDNLANAPQVRCPVLVVHGDRDEVVPLALGKRLCAAFGGPAELLVVPGAGHNDLSLAGDGLVGKRVAAFMRGG